MRRNASNKQQFEILHQPNTIQQWQWSLFKVWALNLVHTEVHKRAAQRNDLLMSLKLSRNLQIKSTAAPAIDVWRLPGNVDKTLGHTHTLTKKSHWNILSYEGCMRRHQAYKKGGVLNTWASLREGLYGLGQRDVQQDQQRAGRSHLPPLSSQPEGEERERAWSVTACAGDQAPPRRF